MLLLRVCRRSGGGGGRGEVLAVRRRGSRSSVLCGCGVQVVDFNRAGDGSDEVELCAKRLQDVFDVAITFSQSVVGVLSMTTGGHRENNMGNPS